MPTQRHDTMTDRRQNLMMLAGGVVLLAGMVVMKLSGSSLPLFIGIPMGLGCIFWALFSPLLYRCPKCGARLRFLSPPQDGAAIKQFCRSCDVEWDTGWKSGADGVAPNPGPSSKADAPIPEEVLNTIKEALLQNRMLDAIKLCRTSTGATLSEAKHRVERLEDDLRHESPESLNGPTHPDVMTMAPPDNETRQQTAPAVTPDGPQPSPQPPLSPEPKC